MENQRMLTPREAAQRLGISLNAVYALIWVGKIPAERHKNRWLLTSAAIEERLTKRLKGDESANGVGTR